MQVDAQCDGSRRKAICRYRDLDQFDENSLYSGEIRPLPAGRSGLAIPARTTEQLSARILGTRAFLADIIRSKLPAPAHCTDACSVRRGAVRCSADTAATGARSSFGALHCAVQTTDPLWHNRSPTAAGARVRTHMLLTRWHGRAAHTRTQWHKCNADYQFLEESQRSLDVAVRLQRELGAQGYKPLTYKLKMLSTKARTISCTCAHSHARKHQMELAPACAHTAALVLALMCLRPLTVTSVTQLGIAGVQQVGSCMCAVWFMPVVCCEAGMAARSATAADA
jgi:hypothetical protein